MPRGDAVLRIIAKKLTEAAGPEGICGRLGGGTFALVFENTPENMKRFRSIKYFDCSEEGIKFPVTMRFGIYIPTDFETNPHIGLNFATLSMDKNVSTTQNTFTLYSESFRKQTKREIEITAKLQPALNNNEFKLWFQPQYKASTGELIGAEALCRWFSNDEIIMPGVFIPISEKSGFIKTLDVEIWRMAFQTLRKWIDAGIKPIPLSVNISRISTRRRFPAITMYRPTTPPFSAGSAITAMRWMSPCERIVGTRSATDSSVISPRGFHGAMRRRSIEMSTGLRSIWLNFAGFFSGCFF